jgi:competence protein ComEC
LYNPFMNLQAWRYRRFHPVYLIGWCCAGILAGILVSKFASFAPGIFWLAVAVVGAVGLFRGRRWWAVVLIMLCGLVVGWERGATLQRELAQYKPYYGRQVVLSGKVMRDIVVGSGSSQEMRLGDVRINDKELPGEVWVSGSTQLEIKRSDIAIIEGKLGEGFGTFPASMFRGRIISAERSEYGDVGRDVRDRFADGVREGISEPESSLGIGYLTGQRSALPVDLDDQLRLLGLTHVVVASGFHLTTLVRFARRAFVRVSRYMAATASSAMIGAFVLVTGFSPSMSRAALITGLSLLAWYYGRRIHPFVLLLFGAVVTALINPFFIWGDLGWFLSFAAFAGVLLLAPLLQHLFWPDKKKPGAMKEILVMTMAAQLATMPIIAFTFSQYSALALPANLLILPLVPLAMLLTFFAGVAGIIAPAISMWVGMPATAVLSYMTSAIDKLAGLPWAGGEITFGALELVSAYALLLLFGLFLWRRTGHDFRGDNVVE